MSFGDGSCHTDEHGGEEGEHHSLNEAYQTFETHHKNAHNDAHGAHTVEHASRHRSHEEDDARHCHGNGVSRHHIGKESNHQSEGLRKNTDELNDGDNGYRCFQPCGNLRPEDVLPVVLVA